ncbi:MAG: hypothetical protein HY648_03455 [Acidobacteria bacterium]|nr:hypothetical protein [Acidobacteriota bacterium]
MVGGKCAQQFLSSMNPDLQTLMELQKLDDIIRELETEVHSLPRKIVSMESQLSEHIRAVEASKKNFEENQRLRRRRENDIAALRDKISRFKDQSLEVKTNEQYRALLHEIEYNEGEIRKLEDQILAEMIDSEALEKKLREAEQSLTAERARVQQEVAEATRRKEDDEQELREVRVRRSEVQSRLAPQVYEQYERVARQRKGQAVVPVRNGNCGACNVRLRPQAYAQSRSNETVIYCESCGRILFYAAEPAGV